MHLRTALGAPVAFALSHSLGVAHASADTPDVHVLMSDGTTGAWTAPERSGPAYVERYGGGSTGPTFTVEYLDVTNNTNEGFDDPSFGSTARDTVGAVFAYLTTVIADTGSAEILFLESEMDGSGALASAGPFFFVTDCTQPFTVTHITTGNDPLGGTPDAQGIVDFGWNWNVDLGGPGGGEADLFSVILHEITHGLGFASSLLTSCAPSCCIPTPGFGSRIDSFDELLVQGNTGAPLIDCQNGEFLGGDLEGGSGGVEMDGSAVNDAWANAGGSGSPPLYTPGSWLCGGSIGHWDSDDSAMPDDVVMQPSIPFGTERRAYHPLDQAALVEFGYTVGTLCAADLSGNGVTDVTDLLIMLGAWGTGGGDITGDGNTDTSDLLAMLGAWGPC